MGAFNTTKIPVEMLEIPLAQWNYIDLTKATVRLVIVATKERYLRQQFCQMERDTPTLPILN